MNVSSFDEGNDLLAVLFVRNANHSGLRDRWVCNQALLKLRAAVADNQVLDTAGDNGVTFVVYVAFVACVELIDIVIRSLAVRLCRFEVIPMVAFLDATPTKHNLTPLASRRGLAWWDNDPGREARENTPRND
ncbi:hypothetical protein ACHAQH_009243, partial [Verticillium albo-atrum]